MIFTIELNAIPHTITINREADASTAVRVQNKAGNDRVMAEIGRDFNDAMDNLHGR